MAGKHLLTERLTLYKCNCFITSNQLLSGIRKATDTREEVQQSEIAVMRGG